MPYSLHDLLILSLTLIPGFGMLLLAKWAWRFRGNPAGRELITFASLGSASAILYFVELEQNRFTNIILWANLGYMFTAWIPASVWVFVNRYLKPGYKPSPHHPIYWPPLVFTAMMLLDPWIATFRLDPQLIEWNGLSLIQYSRGPTSILLHLWSYTMVVGAILKLVMARQRVHPAFRWRMSLLAASLSLPILLNLGQLVGVPVIPYLDVTPLAMCCAAIGIAVAMGTGEVLDVVPIARETVFEKIGEGVLIADTNHRIVDVNHRAEEILQTKANRLLHTNLWDCLGIEPPDDLASSPREIRRDYPDFRVVEIRHSLLDLSGHTRAHLVVLQDVTERHLQQRALLESHEQMRGAMEEAQAASLAKSKFLANMSHEMRTPLNGILGVLQVLEHEDLPWSARAKLSLISSSGESLLALINDLLDLTVAESGKLKIVEEPFMPDLVLQDIVATHSTMAHAKGISVKYFAQNLTGYRVVGDRDRIRQVMHNLIGNAVKFTDEGGVEVRAKSTLEGGHANLAIAIQDTGIGIASSMIDSVFSSFVQADASVRRRHGGVGLGLTIAKRMVETMGGSIEAESQEGVGSTFRVNLRLPVEQGASADTERELRNNLKGMSLLVVEDNPVNRLVARELLQVLGCRVDLAENGAEAIEYLKTHRPDAVLMDVHMPVMDGLQATRMIRSQGNEVPILAMTASAMSTDRDVCLKAGMDGFLSKPLVLHDLLESLVAAVSDGGTLVGAQPKHPA